MHKKKNTEKCRNISIWNNNNNPAKVVVDILMMEYLFSLFYLYFFCLNILASLRFEYKINFRCNASQYEQQKFSVHKNADRSERAISRVITICIFFFETRLFNCEIRHEANCKCAIRVCVGRTHTFVWNKRDEEKQKISNSSWWCMSFEMFSLKSRKQQIAKNRNTNNNNWRRQMEEKTNVEDNKFAHHHHHHANCCRAYLRLVC